MAITLEIADDVLAHVSKILDVLSYYFIKNSIMRVELPSLEMCMVPVHELPLIRGSLLLARRSRRRHRRLG
jgi:hypothetical protein